MDSMSPQQGTMGQNRSDSLSGDSSKKKMKTLAQRRQSAPSLVISKALTRSRSTSRENCLTPLSPESSPLVQVFLAERPGRLFLGHVHVQLKTGLQAQERLLFLFTDAMLIAKAKSPTHLKLKARVRVCEMWTAGCLEEVCEGSISPERSFVMGWPTYNCVATFSSVELRDKWLTLIKTRINEEKEKDDPKTIPLKIFAKDIGNCAYAKTLAVSNHDSTTDVVRMALLQFGKSGCVKDHQLWVSSSKDDPPYPLIGHEFPFSIKMSHIRDGGSSGGRLGGGPATGRDPASPPDCPEVLLLDQCLPPDTQCQFILKPSRPAPGQPPLTEPPGQHKSFKRKRSLINWTFWKGSSHQLDDPPLSPTSLSPAQGRLFGRSLASVCSPDQGLPKPVMDMLVFLYLEGPYTRGVFRRSAGARACRELRDRLDGGTEDPEITHQSVFVVAAVLKDFLRNIPGSLLRVELYEQWTSVMEREGGEERTGGTQRLLHLLPGENLLLLRHVVAVLHRIQGNAHENQMNTFNLSVCIAPSMLWAPSPSTPEEEGEGTKKVCELVHFLIENCSSVLGEDVTSLFRCFSQKSSSSEHGSEASSFQMNDSSYDSLENELNDEPESPYQQQLPLRNKVKPDSRSCDSVITLSDCDPDPEMETDLLLQLPPLSRPRRFSPAVRQSRPHQASSPMQGPRRLRRSSEPALGKSSTASSGKGTCHADQHHLPMRKASYDAAMEGEGEEEEEDEVFMEQGLSRLQLKEGGRDGCDKGRAKVQSGERRKMKHKPLPPLRLDASCSSLSSPATSPTGSSLSSLDSAFSQYSIDYVTNGVTPVTEPTPLSPLFPGQPHLSPRGSPPQTEVPPDWLEPSQLPQTSQSHHPHSIHPNTWLRRGRRLSLRQPDNGHVEDGVALVNGSSESSLASNSFSVKSAAMNRSCQRRSSSPPSYQQALLQLQRNRSPFYRGAEKPLTVRELRLLQDQASSNNPQTHAGGEVTASSNNPKPHTGSEVPQRLAGGQRVQPPQGFFYGQRSTTLVLRRQKSHSLAPAMEDSKGWKTHSLPRRASEPIKVTTTANPNFFHTLDRPHTSKMDKGHSHRGGLRVSDVDLNHPPSSAGSRFCLSPSATQTVRDYFSSQGQADADICLQKSQEVALAIVQGKREWQSRRCSDPRVDEFEQLFFAEESYV